MAVVDGGGKGVYCNHGRRRGGNTRVTVHAATRTHKLLLLTGKAAWDVVRMLPLCPILKNECRTLLDTSQQSGSNPDRPNVVSQVVGMRNHENRIYRCEGLECCNTINQSGSGKITEQQSDTMSMPPMHGCAERV